MMLIEAVRRLLKSWWQVDRVRINPEQSRLLALKPPCYLRIGSQTLTVCERHAKAGKTVTSTCSVYYDCEGDLGTGTLRVELVALNQPLAVSWLSDGREQSLAAFEISVFEPSG